ncbi:hypothetical protein OR1_03558 [Geobacter sp. OR-1]|nr:hypothetical protein OR1_03558 [Geobacter sp. OR-1]
MLSSVFMFTPEMIQRSKGITAIEGGVLDLDGKPVEGVVVFAYLSPEAMGRPLFVSDRTDKKGEFLLRVHGSETFYLKVRGVIGGGAPENGEYMNVTEDFQPVQVKSVINSKTKGVVLKVKKFLRPEGVMEPTGKAIRAWKKIEDIK